MCLNRGRKNFTPTQERETTFSIDFVRVQHSIINHCHTNPYHKQLLHFNHSVESTHLVAWVHTHATASMIMNTLFDLQIDHMLKFRWIENMWLHKDKQIKHVKGMPTINMSIG